MNWQRFMVMFSAAFMVADITEGNTGWAVFWVLILAWNILILDRMHKTRRTLHKHRH